MWIFYLKQPKTYVTSFRLDHTHTMAFGGAAERTQNLVLDKRRCFVLAAR